MKKPIFIIFNDVHLTSNNGQQIIESIDHLIKHALKIGIKNLILAGDLFESRSFQRLDALQTFDLIIQKINQAGLTLYLFPGNHDKTDYKSFSSFLDIYRYHEGVKFFRELKNIEIEGFKITLLPFFDDEILVPMIKEAEGGDILVSHFELLGSRNRGKASDKETITPKDLKKWKKVYLGHYHDPHEITKNIVHLPALRQNGFHENTNKGFSVIYDDLSYEIVKGVFQKYYEYTVDLSETSIKELKELIDCHKDIDGSVRFNISGTESETKAFDKSIFEGTGIVAKIDHEKVFDTAELKMPKAMKRYEEEQIREKLEEFCKIKGYDLKTGLIYFNEFMDDKKERKN